MPRRRARGGCRQERLSYGRIKKSFQLPKILEERFPQSSIVERSRRMVNREHGEIGIELLRSAVHLGNGKLRKKFLQGMFAESDNDFRSDDRKLQLHPWKACRLFTWLRITVTRRAVLHDVCDVDVTALQSDGSEELIQKFARRTHERTPEFIFFLPRRLPDENNGGFGVPLPEHGICVLRQRTPFPGFQLFTEEIEGEFHGVKYSNVSPPLLFFLLPIKNLRELLDRHRLCLQENLRKFIKFRAVLFESVHRTLELFGEHLSHKGIDRLRRLFGIISCEPRIDAEEIAPLTLAIGNGSEFERPHAVLHRHIAGNVRGALQIVTRPCGDLPEDEFFCRSPA